MFLFLQLKRKRMRGELSKSGKKWPRYRLPKFVDCPTFFAEEGSTTRCVHWVLDWWHTSRSPPHWAHLLCVSRRQHPCAIIRPLRFMYASMRHWSTRHFWRSFSVQPPPFSGKKRTQFSKFEVVESKYRRFNWARWQLTAQKCDQKFPFGSNSTSRCRRETKDIAPWSSALRLSCAMLGLIVLAMPLTPRPLKKKRYVCATAPHTLGPLVKSWSHVRDVNWSRYHNWRGLGSWRATSKSLGCWSHVRYNRTLRTVTSTVKKRNE